MDLDKNGAIAVVSLCGLIMAALVQPVAGFLSDRSRMALGQRTPFMVLGAAGLTVAVFSLGTADAFAALLVATIGLQTFGNLMQGPANALLIDHVPPSRIGAAAGVLNLYKVAGAGTFVVAVLLLMSNYDRETGRIWLWLSLTMVVVVMLVAAAWTIVALRPRRGERRLPVFAGDPPRQSAAVLAASFRAEARAARRGSYIGFLASLAFVIAAMSSMQVYSIPFLEDAVGLDNPARGAAVLALVVALATAVIAVPAGRLTDRFGHRALLLAAGLAGAAGALLLIMAGSLLHVMLIGILVGLSIGTFVSVTWAMANSMVAKTMAARDLGYTGIATLAGAAIARFAGPGIDVLNAHTPELGYKAMLTAIALAFLVAPVLLGIVNGGRPINAAAGQHPLQQGQGT
jgi:MFS family permease